MNPTPESLDRLPDSDETDDDPRLFRAAQTYLAEVEAGHRPARQEFIARFPDIANELGPYLEAIDMVHAEPLRNPSRGQPAADESLVAEPLGDFRLVREIGRGGMGVVYEAVQLSLGRRVALKVLSFAGALDGKQLERFKNEAQAAAHLHHTNIVPVHAVGSERGVHYYAMQLIEGQNLAELIRQIRSFSGKGGDDPESAGAGTRRPSQAGASGIIPESTGPAHTHVRASRPADAVTAVGAELSTQRATHSVDFCRAAARLAVQAAEALEHAHQLGVIHRDVKPANLLLDGRGHLWITDFGLAQFHSSLALTRTGDLMGTLRYMSPEQASGQRLPLDARTDVYSLGATFYELLTLEPLFDGADHRRLLRQILDEEPRPPRSLEPSIPTELETILLKSVSKSPADRYATAQEFADDLRRYLDNRPILARRPTVIERTRKWARRHPSVIVASVVVLLLVSVASLVSTVVVLGEQAKATRAAQQAEEAYQKADKAAKQADAAYQVADKAAKSERQRANEAEAQFRLAQRSVAELFQLSEQELADRPGVERLRLRVLDSVLAYYREFIELRQDDPKAQADLHEMQKQVEKIVADLAVLQEAGRLDLLRQPDVVKDLRLNDDQRTKIKGFFDNLEEQRKKSSAAFDSSSSEERRQRFLDQARTNDLAVRLILHKTQWQRLPEIALQLQSMGAFKEADVAVALKLTPDQRKLIREINDEVFWAGMQERKTLGGPPGGGRGRPEDFNKWNEQKRKQDANDQKRKQEALERILTLLTAEQTQRWKEMTGEPFKGTVQFFPFGPGPH